MITRAMRSPMPVATPIQNDSHDQSMVGSIARVLREG